MICQPCDAGYRPAIGHEAEQAHELPGQCDDRGGEGADGDGWDPWDSDCFLPTHDR